MLLVQGILLVVLSFIIFNNPATVLITISLWLGVLVLVSGVLGILGYLFLNKNEKDISSLLWSLATAVIGILLISKIALTMKVITILFGLMVSLVGFLLLQNSWSMKSEFSKWWLVAILGAIILILGISSMLDISSGAESISTILGIAVLLSGIGFITLAFLKRKIVTGLKNKISKI